MQGQNKIYHTLDNMTKSNYDIQKIEKLADKTYELMDAYRTGLSWLLDYCDKNSLPYPDLDKALSLIRISGLALDKTSTESKHDKHYRQGNRTCVKELLPYRLIFIDFLAVTFG